MLPVIRSKRTVLFLVSLFVLAVIAALLKFTFLPLTFSADYDTYIETAKLFSGLPTQEIAAQRILKPLGPLLVAALAPVTKDFSVALLAQNLFFYFALVIVFFIFAKQFFREEQSAFVATALFLFGYPILRYGLEPYTDTGAWFFYVVSLGLSFAFLKRPSQKLYWTNFLIILTGFLWKEYTIVNLLIFNVLIFFHPRLSRMRKVFFLLILNGLFLGVNLLWQMWVYNHYQYSYADWTAVAVNGFAATQWNIFNLAKSMFGVLTLAWLAVPLGFWFWRHLDEDQRLFLKICLPLPFLAVAWGWVSSRLYYVIAPSMLLLAVHGLRHAFKRFSFGLVVTAFVVAANFAWLFLSYSYA